MIVVADATPLNYLILIGHPDVLQKRFNQVVIPSAVVDEVGEYIRSVESHLNVVVDMFDRHLREDHGQRPS